MYDFQSSPVLIMFQHKIKAYQNIYVECVALHDKSGNGILSNEERVVARAQAQIMANSALTSLSNRLKWPGLHDSQKAQINQLISDFYKLKDLI